MEMVVTIRAQIHTLLQHDHNNIHTREAWAAAVTATLALGTLLRLISDVLAA